MIDDSTRSLVFRRAGFRCEYCRIPQTSYWAKFTIGHILAQQHTRDDRDTNLALCCPQCNSKKGPNLAGIDPSTGTIITLFNPRIEFKGLATVSLVCRDESQAPANASSGTHVTCFEMTKSSDWIHFSKQIQLPIVGHTLPQLDVELSGDSTGAVWVDDLHVLYTPPPAAPSTTPSVSGESNRAKSQ